MGGAANHAAAAQAGGVVNALVAARLNRGLSQRAAAEEIGVNRGVLERAEAGKKIHPANAKLIADFYEIAVTDFREAA